jgi:hypothetical protein
MNVNMLDMYICHTSLAHGGSVTSRDGDVGRSGMQLNPELPNKTLHPKFGSD